MIEKINVICIDNTNYPLSLIINKKYEVFERKNNYVIIDENLEQNEYPKFLFCLEEEMK